MYGALAVIVAVTVTLIFMRLQPSSPHQVPEDPALVLKP
jgi:hypothetical protein